MKNIIRWLADIAGVTADIEKKAYLHIADEMAHTSTWLGGSGRDMAGNCLFLYSLFLRHCRLPDNAKLRQKLDELAQNEVPSILRWENSAARETIVDNVNTHFEL